MLAVQLVEVGLRDGPQNEQTLLSVDEKVELIAQRWHFHNTRNTGYANALTALGTGALDASIGGFGGCPFAPAATGNIAAEDLVYALNRPRCPTGSHSSHSPIPQPGSPNAPEAR